MKTLRHTASITLAVVALALSGCTYASEESASPESNSNGAEPSSNAEIIESIKKDLSIAAMVPDDIKKSGTLRNGVAANYAPAEFIDTDGSTVIGYITAISKLMGLKVATTNAAFPSLIPALGSKYDVSVSAFTITLEREKQVTMASYFKAGFSMAQRDQPGKGGGSPHRPEGRYAKSSDNVGLVPSRIMAVILAVLAVALLVAVGAYIYEQFTAEKIEGEVTDAQVIDDHTVSATASTSVRTPSWNHSMAPSRSSGGLPFGTWRGSAGRRGAATSTGS